ncbi:MAG: ferredoxin [Rhodospirillales bacterium]
MIAFLTYDSVVSALAVAGLASRGGFHPRRSDDFGDHADFRVRTVVLAGNVAGSLWPWFVRDREDEPDPLDAWSKRVLGGVAGELPGRVAAVFPSDKPYLPFQDWAMRADNVYPSPIGPLIHPVFGMWHAYRGALLLEERLDLPPVEPLPSPCVTCEDKPCLSTCPVGALTASRGLDVAACVDHLQTDDGDACFEAACLARAACPVGAGFNYAPDQARFHMEAFLKARLAAQATD